MLTVKREEAVKLFETLDYHTASKWNNERLAEKFLGLKKLLEDDASVDDADLKKLLNKVLKAEEITVTGDAPEAAPAKAEKPAKAKAAKVEKAAKPAKEKAAKPAKEPSNRKRVYLLWKEIPKKERVAADANVLRKKAKIEEDRLPYVVRWIRDWNRGKFLLKNDE